MKKPFLLLSALLTLISLLTKGSASEPHPTSAVRGSKEHRFFSRAATSTSRSHRSNRLTAQSTTSTSPGSSSPSGSSTSPGSSTSTSASHPSINPVNVMDKVEGVEAKAQNKKTDKTTSKEDAIREQINEAKESPKVNQ